MTLEEKQGSGGTHMNGRVSEGAHQSPKMTDLAGGGERRWSPRATQASSGEEDPNPESTDCRPSRRLSRRLVAGRCLLQMKVNGSFACVLAVTGE
uniref:Uncharacterized protein n=1 Tax=Aegilops tauschii TaxID=37682 RepID=M8CMH8_AEGTA